ncbi:vanadium-dependent haloperoxidase [Reichenbachiella ulvae]|uniref:Vanadium-dependent haloperoxidase n=1 Tax=Reichenbachiella ulvae TaxID=2980104 RepID=A0ABT3CT88_9BACT|nr:vanadium-dependent haloperoxidase [Reichenbachiella ulvae]MCV9386458.1 vanadium-dependent haloperoxidase [Reichenbachiella ulvae]
MNRLILAFTALIFITLACKPQEKEMSDYNPTGQNNVAYQWGKIALEATANDTDMFKPRPTITSRFLGLIFTSIFDAWTRFDEKATPVYLSGVERRPAAEMTTKNKEIAISYAAYRAMSEYYYSDSTMYRDFMESMGLDPDDMLLDPSTAVGIGNLAAKAVIEARRNDGSNQYGELSGDSKKPYYDYTEYSPVNSVEENVDLEKWQPKYFTDDMGKKFAPSCLTPYWQLVKPLMLDSSSQYRPGPPPAVGSEQLAQEVKEVVELQANLTDENRALVEFMRDGPKSVQQAGHWLIFAQEVSIRDNHTLDDDVKMYFLVEAVAMDGFIACWDSKMHYDFARPFALVHDYFKGEDIYGWAGPEAGWKDMKGEEWRPYSPNSFLCPPFPSYVSGHSTISGGCAEALRLFKGDDTFGSSVDLVPGSLTEPNNIGDTVTLQFPTFTKAGEMAGISRVMGGYHIQADNIEGLNLGRNVARDIYKKYLKLVGEDSKPIAEL